jgi:hypothetical protein
MNELIEIANQAKDAFQCAEAIMQLGTFKVAAGIALYEAVLNENNPKMGAASKNTRRDAIGRNI